MADTKWLKDENNVKFFPRTHINSVKDDDGNTVGALLGGKADKSDTYTKAEVNNLIPSIQQDIVVGALPTTGSPNTIYRVPSTSSYTDWAWDGTQWVELATYNNAIDDVPTQGSDNLVKSGGVYPIQEKLWGTTKTIDSSKTTARNQTAQYYPIDRTLTSGQTYHIRFTTAGWGTGTYAYISTMKGAQVKSGGGVDNLKPLLGGTALNTTYEFDYTPTINANYIYFSTPSSYTATGNETVTIETFTLTPYDYIPQLLTENSNQQTEIDALNLSVFGNGRRLIAETDLDYFETYYPMGATLTKGRRYRITLTLTGWVANYALASIQSCNINSGFGNSMGFPSLNTNQTQTIDYTPIAGFECFVRIGVYSNYSSTGNEEVKIRIEEYIEDDTEQGEAFISKGTLATDEVLSNPRLYTRKHMMQSVSVGTFESIRVGNAVGEFASVYAKIDSTKIEIYYFGGSSFSKVAEYNHGLTIGTRNIVSMISDNTEQIVFKLIFDGVVYTTPTQNYSSGGTFSVKNLGTNSIDVTISTCPFDIDKDVWIVGDSYLSYSVDRWIYYAISNGATDFLLTNLSGGSGRYFLFDVRYLLGLRVPKVIIWCSGMNDGGDTASKPSHLWLGYVQGFLTLAKTFGFTPILCTIPSVPNKSNEQKNAWIENSGYRYLDEALAVGAQADGTWITGMLSSDNVHPTALGAKAIYAQALADIPELMKT